MNPTSRFLNKVQIPTDGRKCWIWIGAKDKDGYGLLKTQQKQYRAHRYSYMIFQGANLDQIPVLMHSCDNPSCVNPNHLKPGTTKDNQMDMVKKGRSAKGEKQGSSKLTLEDVWRIHKYHNEGFGVMYLARRFNVSHTNIRYILNGETWKEVKNAFAAGAERDTEANGSVQK